MHSGHRRCYDARKKTNQTIGSEACEASCSQTSSPLPTRRGPPSLEGSPDRSPSKAPTSGRSSSFSSFDAGVKVAIASQLIFYLAPAIMQPSLFIEIQASPWGGPAAASSYSVVLMTTTVVAMASPIPLGMWAQRRGEREVYAGVTVLATVAALLLSSAPSLWKFAASWGLLSAPLSLRGVRYAYFARHVNPDDLSSAGQLASAAGLLGSLLGPVLAAVTKNSFFWGAVFAAISHAVCAVALATWLPPKPKGMRREKDQDRLTLQICEKCGVQLTETEKPYGTQLCNKCYDSWFRSFKRRVLFCFCFVAGLLELSMNMGVVAAFQPIAVEHFGWSSDQIAAVNFLSSSVSVLVSVGLARLRLPEFGQAATAACLYAASVFCFTLPPLVESRCVLGLVLGLKAQILFMAPFTAAFSRLIGGSRVTNAVTTVLCLAPLIGAALGTAAAPLLLPFAGTAIFMISCCPAVLAVCLMCVGWTWMRERDASGRPTRRTKRPPAIAVVPDPPALDRVLRGSGE